MNSPDRVFSHGQFGDDLLLPSDLGSPGGQILYRKQRCAPPTRMPALEVVTISGRTSPRKLKAENRWRSVLVMREEDS